MMTTRRYQTIAKSEDIIEPLRERAKILLAGLSLLKDGINPDKEQNRSLLDARIGKIKQVEVRLSDIPKALRGKVAGEWLAQFEILKLKLDSDRKPERERPPYTDLEAFDPFIENSEKLLVQVKTTTLKKVPQVIRVDGKPLKEFEGWYIAVIERNPEKCSKDDFLYIPSDRMKRLMDEFGIKEEIDPKLSHHKEQKRLLVKKNWGSLKQYSNSAEFEKAVKAKASLCT